MTEPHDTEVPAANDGHASSAESAKETSKAARLEAKAARLRARDAERATRAEERAALVAATPGGAAPGSSRVWLLTSIVLGVVLVLVVAVAVPVIVHLSSQSHSRGRALAAEGSLDSARATVIADATRYAVDFGSYDYKNIDADFARVISHLTPSFAKTYSSVSAALKQTIVQYKTTETGAVQGAAVQTITATQAIVLVFLDQSVQSTQSATPRIDRNRLKMTLQKQQNGTWLINELDAV